MRVRVARTDDEIAACFPVMRQLRPHLRQDEFVPRIKAQQAEGYELAYVEEDGRPVAVTGFRFGLNLAWGRYLYVDDLVTDESARSRGYGAALLRWLHDLARERGCDQLHLDSGTARTRAHRFYFREGMEISSFHFRRVLP